jgi:hypothetical protein
LSDPTWALCNDVLQRALAQHGATDAGHALCALLWLLRDHHRETVTTAASRAYLEGFELPDPNGGTIAELIMNLATRSASIPWPDAEAEATRPIVACDGNMLSAGMLVVATVLKELIPLWDLEAMEDAKMATRRHGPRRPSYPPSLACEPAHASL